MMKRKAKRPKYHSSPHPRITGAVDSVLHKVSVQDVIQSGWLKKEEARFHQFESELGCWMLETIHPFVREGRKILKILGEPQTSESIVFSMRDKTTQEQRKNMEIQLVEIVEEVRNICRLADEYANYAESQVNQAIAKYCKATKFHPVEEEIPCLQASFASQKLVDPTFLEKVDNILEGGENRAEKP